MTTEEQQSLADAVGAEHAAVYAYGLVDAYAANQRGSAVAAATTAHQTRRDAAMSLLRAAGVAPPQSEAGYVLPAPVTDAPSAIALAAEVEHETAVAWRSVLERSTPVPQGTEAGPQELRSTAVAALIDCAVRLAQWRAVLGYVPPTTPFPGTP